MLSYTADFLFRPDVLGLHWSSFDKYDILIENGLVEAEIKIVDLLKTLKYRKSLRYRFTHLSSK